MRRWIGRYRWLLTAVTLLSVCAAIGGVVAMIVLPWVVPRVAP
jgi:hypothetical protein